MEENKNYFEENNNKLVENDVIIDENNNPIAGDDVVVEENNNPIAGDEVTTDGNSLPIIENESVEEESDVMPLGTPALENNVSEPVVNNKDSLEEQNNKDVNKNKRKPNWLIAILILLILGAGSYFVTSMILKGKDENKPQNNISTPSDNVSTPSDNIATSTDDVITPSDDKTVEYNIPSDLSKYTVLHWDYNKLYNYYFKMGDDKKVNIDSKFTDVKIENNKLYWKVDNNWEKDSKITDDVLYFEMNFNAIDKDYFMVVTSSKVYYIQPEDDKLYCAEDYTTSSDDYVTNSDDQICTAGSYRTLTNKLYSKFQYKEISASGKISKVSKKEFSDCEIYTKYYFEINNKVYVLNNSDKFVEVNSYLNESNTKKITSLNNECIVGNENALTIENDGTIKNIIDENDNAIKVKHYVLLRKSDKEYFDIVIDTNNKLYIIDRETSIQKSVDTVKSFEYSMDKSGKEKLNIDLEINNDIVKK